MFSKILEIATGKDDLERVACKEDPSRLNAYLRTRPLLIPRRPMRFLDASTFTQEELLELIHEESEECAGDHFEPWILESDGKKSLPAFSSTKKLEAFSATMSKELNKVFWLGYFEVLLADIAENVDVDVVILNAFSSKSWEIAIGSH